MSQQQSLHVLGMHHWRLQCVKRRWDGMHVIEQLRITCGLQPRHLRWRSIIVHKQQPMRKTFGVLQSQVQLGYRRPRDAMHGPRQLRATCGL